MGMYWMLELEHKAISTAQMGSVCNPEIWEYDSILRLTNLSRQEKTMDKDKLYNRIDAEEDMTDSEKREAYFSEIDDEERNDQES